MIYVGGSSHLDASNAGHNIYLIIYYFKCCIYFLCFLLEKLFKWISLGETQCYLSNRFSWNKRNIGIHWEELIITPLIWCSAITKLIILYHSDGTHQIQHSTGIRHEYRLLSLLSVWMISSGEFPNCSDTLSLLCMSRMVLLISESVC